MIYKEIRDQFIARDVRHDIRRLRPWTQTRERASSWRTTHRVSGLAHSQSCQIRYNRACAFANVAFFGKGEAGRDSASREERGVAMVLSRPFADGTSDAPSSAARTAHISAKVNGYRPIARAVGECARMHSLQSYECASPAAYV